MTFSQIDSAMLLFRWCLSRNAIQKSIQMAFQQKKVYRVVLQFEFAKRGVEMRRVNSHASHFFSGPFSSQRRITLYHFQNNHSSKIHNYFQTKDDDLNLENLKLNIDLFLGKKYTVPWAAAFLLKIFHHHRHFDVLSRKLDIPVQLLFFYFNGRS